MLYVRVKHKMVYSDYVKQRILFFRRSGKCYAGIERSLAEEDHTSTAVGSSGVVKIYVGTIARVPGSGQTLAEEISQIVSHLTRHPIK